MKKLVISMIAVVSAIIMCFALAGCSKDVKGNTYVFSDFTITGNYPEEMQDEVDEEVAYIKAMYEGVEVKFNDDGTYTQSKGEYSETGYYKQDGKKVYYSDSKEGLDAEDVEYYEVDGKKLVNTSTETEEGDITLTYTITLKKK